MPLGTCVRVLLLLQQIPTTSVASHDTRVIAWLWVWVLLGETRRGQGWVPAEPPGEAALTLVRGPFLRFNAGSRSPGPPPPLSSACPPKPGRGLCF